MADNLFNVGTPMSAEDYLKIISFMNKRESDDNRLIKGLGDITGVSTSSLTSSGLDTSLRRYSTANDEEITAKIIYGMADGDYKTEKEYVREYKLRNYPPLFMEKALAEWRRTKGREESAATARYSKDAATQARKMEPGAYTKQQQAITKEEERIKDADLTESMSIVALHAAQNDIKAIRKGANYYDTVQKRIANETDGWTKVNLDYYKALMDEADLEPKATATTKAVYDTRSGERRWMTEDDIQSLNKANPGTIVPESQAPDNLQQVSGILAASAAQILYDDAALTAAEVDFETARELLTKWSQDKSWMVRFTEIAPEHTKLHKDWHDTVKEVMAWWKQGDGTTTVEGEIID